MSEHGFEQYPRDISRLAVDILQQELVDEPDVGMYYISLLEDYTEHPFLGETMQHIAAVVEPVDRMLGAQPGLASAKAFYDGAIIGSHVAEILGGEKLLNNLERAPVPGSLCDDEDPWVRLHAQAELFMEAGRKKYIESEIYHPFIEKLEDFLVTDITKLTYFRAGFGFMLHMADGAQRILDQEKLEDQLENCDWDQAFIDMLPDQS